MRFAQDNVLFLSQLVQKHNVMSSNLTLYHWVSFSSEAMYTLYDLYFYFWCEVALDTWAMGFPINSLGLHDLHHTHSLASLQGKHSPASKHFCQLKTAHSARNGAPTRPRSTFYACLCLKGRYDQASADQRLFIASRHSHAVCVHCMSWICPPTSPYPTFFIREKIIFKTDCATDYMQPKSDDAK